MEGPDALAELHDPRFFCHGPVDFFLWMTSGGLEKVHLIEVTRPHADTSLGMALAQRRYPDGRKGAFLEVSRVNPGSPSQVAGVREGTL